MSSYTDEQIEAMEQKITDLEAWKAEIVAILCEFGMCDNEGHPI